MGKEKDFQEGSDTSIPSWVESQAMKIMSPPPDRIDSHRGRGMGQDHYADYDGGRFRSSSPRNGRYASKEHYDRTSNNRRDDYRDYDNNRRDDYRDYDSDDYYR